LADSLAAGDWQRLVRIGGIGKPSLDEVLTRHFIERAQHHHIGDAAPTQVEQELHATDAAIASRLLGHARPLSATRVRVRIPIIGRCWRDNRTMWTEFRAVHANLNSNGSANASKGLIDPRRRHFRPIPAAGWRA